MRVIFRDDVGHYLSCAFVAAVADDAIESTVSSIVGTSTSFLSIYTTVASSFADGSVNALISLKLGIITRRTFNPFQVQTKAEIRKGAYVEALGTLTSIVGEKAKTAASAVGQVSIKAAVATAEASKQAVNAVGDAVFFCW